MPDIGVRQCCDCGAFVLGEGEIEHHPTCKPGESARWARYYEEGDTDE